MSISSLEILDGMNMLMYNISIVNKIDKLDEQIMILLEQNARQSSQVVAKKLNVSSATIRRRLNLLIKSGVLRIIAFKDFEKAGLPVGVIIGLNIDHHLVDSVMEEIRKQPEVHWACTTTGRFNAILCAHFRSNEDFSLFLRKKIAGIKGIKDSETFMCLHVEKQGQVC
jgi:Lrp/AsnC family transcriptional regulator for asnA, asnC and gidA